MAILKEDMFPFFRPQTIIIRLYVRMLHNEIAKQLEGLFAGLEGVNPG